MLSCGPPLGDLYVALAPSGFSASLGLPPLCPRVGNVPQMTVLGVSASMSCIVKALWQAILP